MRDNTCLVEKLQAMGNGTTLKEMQDYIAEMVAVRGWQDESPQDTLLMLTEELGELAKEVRKRCTNIQTDLDKRGTENLQAEAADVFLMLLALCRTLNIDLTRAFIEKEMENCHRNWG